MSRDSVFGYATGELPIPSCGSDAVRMVVVHPTPELGKYGGGFTSVEIPMCAACHGRHASRTVQAAISRSKGCAK